MTYSEKRQFANDVKFLRKFNEVFFNVQEKTSDSIQSLIYLFGLPLVLLLWKLDSKLFSKQKKELKEFLNRQEKDILLRQIK